MRRGAEGGIAIAALFVLGAWEPFSAEQKDVRDGNERYAQKDYAGAGEAYKRAMPKLPSEPTVRFDLGAASYQAWKLAAESPDKAKLLDAARQNWRSAADSPQADPRLRSLAQYNLGNAAFDDGKYDAAIDAYKQALKADPRNEDARYNLELARVQKQKPPPPGGGGQKQQPQNQPQKQQQQSPDGKQDQDQGQGQQQTDDQQKDQKPQGQNQDQDQDQNPQDQDPSQKSQPQDQKQQQKVEAAPKPPQDVDDADRKMEALERRSRDLMVNRQRDKQPRAQKRGDDW